MRETTLPNFSMPEQTHTASSGESFFHFHHDDQSSRWPALIF
jgi:hypothetical protein